jgi:GAF domain-containing protein
MFFLTAGLFIVVETISNNFLEPWLYGHTTGVSNVALVAAAIFWTWLWGPIGLFLSTPLTVCLMVIGKYVPGLHFLSVLLGTEPVLAPEARFYQRMLAMDEEEMLNLAVEYRTQQSVEAFYDNILVPALTMAEEDRHNGTLAEVRQKFIIQSTRDLIQELCQDDELPEPRRGEPFICVPARDDADELAGLMLRHILARRGIEMKVFSVATSPADCAEFIRQEGARTICVSGLPPAASIPARNVCKRIKQAYPRLKIVAGIWTAKGAVPELQKRLAPWADTVATRLKDAAEHLTPVARGVPTHRAQPEVAFRLEDSEPEEARDAVIRELAKAFDVPVSLVSVNTDPDDALCAELEPNGVTIIEDVEKDPKLSENAMLHQRGVRFLASAPLRTGEGRSIGNVCIMDTKPHTVTEHERLLLMKVADELMRVLGTRPLRAA